MRRFSKKALCIRKQNYLKQIQIKRIFLSRSTCKKGQKFIPKALTDFPQLTVFPTVLSRCCGRRRIQYRLSCLDRHTSTQFATISSGRICDRKSCSNRSENNGKTEENPRITPGKIASGVVQLNGDHLAKDVFIKRFTCVFFLQCKLQ